jgi:hypothetical protein
LADAACVPAGFFALADGEEVGALADGDWALDFVAGLSCVAAPVELWRARAGMKAQVTSSAQTAPNRTFRVPLKCLTIQPESLIPKSAGSNPGNKTPNGCSPCSHP